MGELVLCGRCLEPHATNVPCRDGGKHSEPRTVPEDDQTVLDYLNSEERQQLIREAAEAVDRDAEIERLRKWAAARVRLDQELRYQRKREERNGGTGSG